jgi:hypothetical protein
MPDFLLSLTEGNRPISKLLKSIPQRPLVHNVPHAIQASGDANGFSVVDVDLEGLDWFDQQHLPLTRLHRTRSGGLHLLLRHPSGLRNSSSEIAPGVDVRGDGGMIIWWPREGYDVCEAPLAEWPMGLRRQRVRIPKETAPTSHHQGKALKQHAGEIA